MLAEAVGRKLAAPTDRNPGWDIAEGWTQRTRQCAPSEHEVWQITEAKTLGYPLFFLKSALLFSKRHATWKMMEEQDYANEENRW
jgi:hypothetical protein